MKTTKPVTTQLKLVALLLASFGPVLPLGAQSVIPPAAWKQSNAFNNLRLASNMGNNTGMYTGDTLLSNHDGLPSGEPNNANNSQWVTSSKASGGITAAVTAGKVWVVIDLGAVYDLTDIQIWNFNWDSTPGSPTTSLNNRGITQFDLLLRNTAADTNDGTIGGTAINPTGVSDDTNALSNAPVFNLGTTNPWTVALSDQALALAANDDNHAATTYSLTGNTARWIAIRADSYGGNTGGVALGKVRITGTPAPLAIASKVPADDATGVAIGDNLVATFTEDIVAGTGGDIEIRRTDNNNLVESFTVGISSQLTFSGANLTIDPTANLAPGIGYYVQIPNTAVKNAGGSFFAGISDTTSWSFTTDGSAPTLTNTDPADDATGLIISANLVATFSEAVQKGTGNIILKRSSDDTTVETFDVDTSPQISFATNQLTLNPSANLAAGTGYYIQIASTAVVDISGNAYLGISDTTTWSFTTDGTAPAPVSVSPSGSARPHVGTRLMVQFDEPVQVGTSGTVTVHKASDNSVVETIDVTTAGAVTTIGKVVAIARTVALDPNTAYYVNASAGAIQDLSGNPAAAVTGSSAWTFTTSGASPLVIENFNSSTSSLDATTADVFDAAITTAGGSNVWGASSAILENGAASTTASGLAYLNLGSFINDAKNTANGKFELTMTISETSGAWISLGFASNNTHAVAQNFTTIGGRGTIIYRGQASVSGPGELDMFGGPNNTNSVDGPDANTGFRTVTVTLDLTPAGGYNGTDNFGTVSWSDSVLGNLGNFTYSTTQNFGSLLLSLTNGSSGVINGLAFYQISAPANSFASWIGTFSVGGQTGIDDDFDNDGLGNAVENLFGTSPEVFSPGLTAVSTSGGNLKFRHTLSATPASDLTGSYEWSTDLATWNADEATSGGTTVSFGDPVVITPGTPDLVEVTATVSGTPVSKVFARFKAAQN
jgi:hypothetical protein